MTLAERLRGLPLAGLLSLSAIGVLATGTGFGNGFVQDELPLILRNESVHSFRSPGHFLTEPYWHDPFPPALYRPLATTALAVQWSLGGGHPIPFRLSSTVLLIGAGCALFLLASLLLPRALAWSAAALFLAHPVHVEATAIAINQGELAVGALLCLGVALYLHARLRGPLQPGVAAGIVLCYLGAMLFKENGLVLPGLLLAAELTVIPDTRPVRARLTELRPLYMVLGLAAALVLMARTAVLGGDTVGTPTAEALTGLGPFGRAVTMLGVVPHWVRLLFWPAELQADYGPHEIAGGARWGTLQWIGLAGFAAWGICALAWRRKRPALGFALLWMAVALFPVSNVLVPTGVILAERTLFLASAGAALLAAGGIAALTRDLPPQRVWVERVALGGVAALVSLGMARSAVRNSDWRNQETLLRRTVADAPRSYAAHLALARFLEDSAGTAAAEPHFREAAAIEPALVERERRIGDRFRLEGYCRPAVRRYRLPLLIRPRDSAVRGPMVACLLQLGRFEEARTFATPGLEDPAAHEFFRRAIATADSALDARSP